LHPFLAFLLAPVTMMLLHLCTSKFDVLYLQPVTMMLLQLCRSGLHPFFSFTTCICTFSLLFCLQSTEFFFQHTKEIHLSAKGVGVWWVGYSVDALVIIYREIGKAQIWKSHIAFAPGNPFEFCSWESPSVLLQGIHRSGGC
jgi:hypothetical protein